MSDGYEDVEYENFEDADSLDNSENIHVPPNASTDNTSYFCKKGSTIFVTIEDIKQLITQKCKDVSELLGFSEDDAIILYNYFKWRKDLIEGEYFGNEDDVRKKAGLEPETIQPKETNPENTCPLCFDTKPLCEFESLECNHLLCKDCWRELIEYNVTRPENFFFWKCPSQGCNMVVPNKFNLKYIPEANRSNYYKKMAAAYADTSNSMRWCPALDCGYGAEVESVGAKSIECPCGWMFCFKCGLEDHRPCECNIAEEWTRKDEGGGANAKWMLVNTKDCPKCKKAIEKNQGCNYMRCRHPGCAYEFCWLCLSDWKTHNDHFRCNKYDNLNQDDKKKMDNEEQKKRVELQKYVFYYERYVNNSLAIENVNKIMKNIKLEQKELAINLSLTLTQLEFLEQACQVLRNSKRALKWSYAYGFYLSNDLQRNLYEIIQEKMDMYSSELHVMLEQEYQQAKKNIGDFTKFKDHVLASVYKCRQSSETFLEKMEEFEAMILEEEVNAKMNSGTNIKKGKPKTNSKRKAKDITGGDNEEGHKRKSTKTVKQK